MAYSPIYPLGQDSFGVVLSYALPATPLVWVPIANVVNITPPNQVVKKIDVTCITQGDSTLRSIPGTTDPGMITFETIYTADGYSELVGLWGAGVINWQIVMPVDNAGDTITFDFTGFILKNDISQLSEQDKAVTIKTEVQIAAYVNSVDSE